MDFIKLALLFLSIILTVTNGLGLKSNIAEEPNVPQAGIVHLVQQLHNENQENLSDLSKLDETNDNANLRPEQLKGQPELILDEKNDDTTYGTRSKRAPKKGGGGGGGCKKGRK
ncbi:hypothetical protein HHI36_004994 [Cryptolaemus montrouzieri]|uniref:Uncharacterized protein n=1 Tax=Cryptolaemus montrouzieri TaxID=559131 RepID=A0ABD2NSV0_9CUCU